MNRACTAVALLCLCLYAGQGFAEERPYRQAALKAERWLDASGLDRPQGRVWPSVPPDVKTIDVSLYSGTSGVVLFYLGLYRSCGENTFLGQAERGAKYILSRIADEKDMGLYTGLAGMAYVLQESYKASGRTKFRDGVVLACDRLKERAVRAGRGVEWSNVTDIISGSAGIGLFLLYAAKELKDPSLLELANQAGSRLAELGQPGNPGLKWAMSPDYPRLMPNFSHGTAGVAYFLGTLRLENGQRPFLPAALEAGQYLRTVANAGEDGLGCAIFHHEPDGKDLYYWGWCHGPVGTARLFYRLHEATGDEAWRTWVKRSALSILHSGIPDKETPGFWNNVGVCCGSAGVADFFLSLYEQSKDTSYLDFALKLSDQILAKAVKDGAGLKWPQAEHRTRPDFLQAQTGLMQGAAGIGLWLLRLDAHLQGKSLGLMPPDSPFRW